MKNKLFKSSLIYTIGNIFTQGLSFISLPIYTRVMSVTDYGSFSLFSSWVAVLSIIFGLQTNGSFSIAKFKYSDDFDDYVLTCIITSSISFIFMFVFFMIFKVDITNILKFSNTILIFMLFQSYFNFMQIALGQYLIQKQLSINHIVFSLMSSILNISISIFLLFNIQSGFMARVIGGFIPGAILSTSFLIYLIKKSQKIFKIEYLKFILITSTPLIFHLLAHQLLSQLDRIMIAYMLDNTYVALYSFSYTIGMILQIVLGSISTAWVPWYFEEKKKNNIDLINKYKERYLVISSFLTVGFLSVFPEIVDILGSIEYRSNKGFIIFIILGYYMGYLYTFPVNIQFYNENTKLIPVGTFLTALCNFMLNYFMISLWGISGAALATLVSYFLLLLFHHIITVKKYGYDELSNKQYFISIITMCLYSILSYIFISNLIIRWLMCFIIFIILLFKYKNDIILLFKNNI